MTDNPSPPYRGKSVVIRRLLEEFPDWTASDIAAEASRRLQLSVSHQLVYNVRRQLAGKNIISYTPRHPSIHRNPRSQHTPSLQRPPGPPGPPVSDGDAEVQAALHRAQTEIGRPLSTRDIRGILSDIARNPGASHTAKIGALGRLTAMSDTTREELGPGEPLEMEAVVYRLALLLEAAGEALSRRAWRTAFRDHFTETEFHDMLQETARGVRNDSNESKSDEEIDADAGITAAWRTRHEKYDRKPAAEERGAPCNDSPP